MPEYSLIKIATSPNWYIQWFEGGHSRRCTTRTSRRDEAQAFLRAFILSSSTASDGPTFTVCDALDWYWETHGQLKNSSADIGRARTHLKAFFGATLAEDCGVPKQKAYEAERRKLGATSAVIRNELLTLSAALNLAVKDEKISRAPPMHFIPANPIRERWLTRSEVAQLFWKLRTKRRRHLLLFARLALYTGQRSGAILGLHKSKVLLDYGLIDFRKPTDTANKKAVLASLPPNLKRTLAKAVANSKTGFIIEHNGKAPKRIVRGFKQACLELGFGDVSPHTLRHSFATWASLKGVPLVDIGRALGQSLQATTARYAHYHTATIGRAQDAVRRK